MIQLLIQGIGQTLFMTAISTLFAYLIGLPLGMALVYFAKDGIKPKPVLHGVLNAIVNILRSIPFLILMIAVIPFTRFIVGTTLGPKAVIPPLVIAAAPFVGRLVEQSFREVNRGVIEAAISMGASNFQIIRRVYLGESLPSLINGAAIAMTTILGYSAMAGAIGGGGLGAIAISYGYNRYDNLVMFVTCALLVILVQIIEWIGRRVARGADKR